MFLVYASVFICSSLSTSKILQDTKVMVRLNTKGNKNDIPVSYHN